VGAWLRQRKVLLLDLDNTLYDWVSYFAPALRGMCHALSEATGLPSSVLFDELKIVFKAHGTVEYTFALQELPSLRRLHPRDTSAALVARYRPVIEVFQHRRRAYLRPYPGVIAGISVLHEAGFEIFGVTDSRRFQAESRLRQLKLDQMLSGLCCVQDHLVPDADTVAAIRRQAPEHYKSALQHVILLPQGLRKPLPGVLDYVVSSLRIAYDSCLYVGDSLAKDVAMAQAAGIYDCWAAYGTRVSPLDFATLVRVTDWPSKAVRDAVAPSPERLHIFPSFVAESFDSIVSFAVTEPAERPPRQTPLADRPRQLSLLELGPTLSEAQS
jgi:FMN phosphatase YigB (HAD superfamily)